MVYVHILSLQFSLVLFLFNIKTEKLSLEHKKKQEVLNNI